MPGIADFVASLSAPSFARPAEMVSMVSGIEYPITVGDMASTSGRRWEATDYEQVTHEVHVEHSNALHSLMSDTGTPYFLGPLARVNLNAALLTPVARQVAERAGLRVPETDPFFSMAARAAEVALAIEESIRIIRAYNGTIVEAKIVPPTSQNLRHMEEDLRTFLPGVLDRDDDELTRFSEMVIRNYDPCISCATHFLRLEIERS
jgi:coenzyme F420-reducing hydrogenase alpha subunit